jgi:hypothetical protein
MKIRSLFFSAGLLAIVVLLSNCKKEEQTEAPTKAQTNQAVSDRGICVVTIAPFNGSLDVCGVQNNTNQCSVFGGVNLFGNDFIANGASQTYTIQTPTVLRLTRNPNLPSAASMVVVVTTAAGIKKYNMPVFAPLNITINDFCNQI